MARNFVTPATYQVHNLGVKRRALTQTKKYGPRIPCCQQINNERRHYLSWAVIISQDYRPIISQSLPQPHNLIVPPKVRNSVIQSETANHHRPK